MARALTPAKTPLFFPLPCRGHPNLIFDLIGPVDVNEVAEFVMNEFFHRFPLKDILQVDKEVRPWIRQYVAHVCSKKFSIVLRDIHRGYRLVAAAINDVDHHVRDSKDINLFTFADPYERPGWHRICYMLSELNRGLTFTDDPILSMDIIVSISFSFRFVLSNKS
jgi:hypothetical protein